MERIAYLNVLTIYLSISMAYVGNAANRLGILNAYSHRSFVLIPLRNGASTLINSSFIQMWLPVFSGLTPDRCRFSHYRKLLGIDGSQQFHMIGGLIAGLFLAIPRMAA